ncbi:MAG: type IV secretory system conjugative DNA transfer family protein [Oscillibacter sp.]|nr:type IV secretory system conjugative DNA transfer family protein [Oscillibacter sp.]
MNKDTYRILAQGHLRCNNTRRTGLNNNDLIIGPSGAGKTRSYVKPNLLQSEESLIIADTKGSLFQETAAVLRRRGFRVWNLDFTDMASEGPENCGYNPLAYVRYDPVRQTYSEQDILSICATLVPVEDATQPFWEYLARMYMEVLVGYVLECLPPEEHNLEMVTELFGEMPSGNFERLLEELGLENPRSFAYRKFRMISGIKQAEKMHESVRGILSEKLDPFTFEGPFRLFKRPSQLHFPSLGREKTAVFLTISDTDRSADRLAALFYLQALQSLCASAGKDYPNHRLPVPVRLILDDFATNACIPDFDNIISVIRSREISVSVILQSISQLEALYGHQKALTILNNCDNCLYLGGQDVETARYISVKANRTADSILNLPLNEAYLFTRGAPPQKVRKFDLTTHKDYAFLPEAQKENTAPQWDQPLAF